MLCAKFKRQTDNEKAVAEAWGNFTKCFVDLGCTEEEVKDLVVRVEVGAD